MEREKRGSYEPLKELESQLLGKGGPHATARIPAQTLPLRDFSATQPLQTLASAPLDELIASIDGELQSAPFLLPGEARAFAATAASHDLATLHLLISVGDLHYAIPLANVLEIGRVPQITPVPRVPEWIPGVTNLRGEILSVVDLRRFLGLPKLAGDAARMVVVRTVPDQRVAGVIIDRVLAIRPLPLDSVRPIETKPESRIGDYLTGLSDYGDRILIMLDLNRLLLSPEMSRDFS